MKKFEGVKVDERTATVSYKRERGPLAGARATVETSGDLQRRMTATRMVTLGVFSLAAKKKQDSRQLFVTIEGDGYGWVIDVDPDEEKDPRNFAVKFNTAAQRAAVIATQPVPQPVAQPAFQAPPAQQAVSTEGRWAADPWGRYEQRWWNGEQWTEWVSSAVGDRQSDPPGPRS